MKKPSSKVAHNQPKFFFQYCQPAQNQPKSYFLFHKNVSLRNFFISKINPPLQVNMSELKTSDSISNGKSHETTGPGICNATYWPIGYVY